METSLRLGLLILGLVIVVGIIWDVRRKPLVRQRKKPKVQRSRAEIAVAADVDMDASLVSKSAEAEAVIILHVMAKPAHVFLGLKLQKLLDASKLVYGNMQIFHYFDKTLNAKGDPIFSIASAVEPGFFDLTTMDSFVTPGLSLFLRMGDTQDPGTAFELMLTTAQHLALELDGVLQDDRHQKLSLERIEQYRDRIQSVSDFIPLTAVRPA